MMKTEELILKGDDFQEMYEHEVAGSIYNGAMNNITTCIYDNIKNEDIRIKHEPELIEVHQTDLNVELDRGPITPLEEKFSLGATPIPLVDWKEECKLEIEEQKPEVNNTYTGPITPLEETFSLGDTTIPLVDWKEECKLEIEEHKPNVNNETHFYPHDLKPEFYDDIAENLVSSDENNTTITSKVQEVTTNNHVERVVNIRKSKEKLPKTRRISTGEEYDDFYENCGKRRGQTTNNKVNQPSNKTIATWFQCIQCTYKTLYRIKFQRHARIHGRNRKTFAYKLQHRKIHQCSKCSYRTLFLNRLKLHLANHKALTKHSVMHRHSKLNVFVCNICLKTFFSKLVYDAHIFRSHRNNKDLMDTITTKIHECQQCSFKCIYNNQMKTHMFTHKELLIDCEKFSCEHCNYVTYQKYNLNCHLKIHTQIKRFVCTICNKKYVEKVQYNDHIVQNHSDNQKLMALITNKIHKCQVCSYKSVFSGKIKYHMLRHKELIKDCKKFVCEHCDYTTYRKYDFQRHSLVHNKSNEIDCAICDKNFHRKETYYDHILCNHLDNKELLDTITYKIHECEQCSYKCLSSSKMKSHLFIHNSNKQFGCTICSKIFRCKRDYDSHILSKHPENKELINKITYKIHECQQCSFKSLHSIRFKSHMIKHN